MNTEPECVRYYSHIREGRAPDQVSIGTGVNAFARMDGVDDYAHAALGDILDRGRSGRYAVPVGDADERRILAALLNTYIGSNVFDAEDVIATNGSTEAIGLVFEAVGVRGGTDVVLPLPAYFAYELSAARWDLPVRAYYDPEHGRLHEREATGRGRTMTVVNSPESVTGSALTTDALAALERRRRTDDIVVYDCIYQFEDLADTAETPSASRELVRRAACTTDLERTVLLFTASKDLSVPGLRAGMLVTKSRTLRRAVSDVLMERYYAPPPLPTYLMALYLSVLNAAAGTDTSGTLLSLFGRPGPAGAGRRAVASLCDPDNVRGHRARMVRHFERGYDVVRDHLRRERLDGVVTLGARPTAGYSTTLELGVPTSTQDAMSARARGWLRDNDLRVYPHFVFGGDERSWAELYPGRSFIRLNVSGRSADLADRLVRVTDGLASRPSAPVPASAGRA